MSLAELLQERPDIWRGREFPDQPSEKQPGHNRFSSGFAELDSRLAGGGWPQGVIEVCGAVSGDGAMELFLPAMARLSREETRRILLAAPPLPPYEPGFALAGIDTRRMLWLALDDPAQTLWALETAAASGVCSMLFGWIRHCETADIRRLQLAAQRGRCSCILFRPAAAARNPSPAALRLRARWAGLPAREQRLAAEDERPLRVDLLKRRGGFPVQDLQLNRPGP